MSGRTVKSEWQQARRILCIRLDSLGDVLMTTPAIRALKETLHEPSITLLTSPAGAAITPYVPEIDAVLEYESPWMKASTVQPDSQKDWDLISRLRGQFDAAVIFTVYSQNPLPAALLCHLADIPLRLAHCRENPYQLLTDWVKEGEPAQQVRHEVRRQLDLVASVGCFTQDERLSFQFSPLDQECARTKLQAAGWDASRPWIAVHPGVTAPSRQYPPEGFAHAVDRLAQEDGLQIVFTGSTAESKLIDEIRGQMETPAVSLAGTLNLGELGALLEMAPLLLANNTGPVHMAAAVGTAVVDLYALTNPQHSPWGVPSRVLYQDVPCKFCYKSICPEGHHNCLRLVTPERVVAAVRDLLHSPDYQQSGVFDPKLPGMR